MGRSNAAPVHDRDGGQIGVAAYALERDCGTIALEARGSIGRIVPTHAAAAPAINFALRSF